MIRLKNFFEKVGFAPEETDDICTYFSFRTFKKNEYILRQGENCTRIVYVLKGCSRAYYSDENEKENILYFGFEGWWLGDVESFFNKIPSRLAVQALEENETAVIEQADFEKLVEKYPKFRDGYMQLIRNNLVAMIQKINEERLVPVEERYKKMLETQPHIITRIPQRQIARYLGIEPPSLSRIRKRLTGGYI